MSRDSQLSSTSLRPSLTSCAKVISLPEKVQGLKFRGSRFKFIWRVRNVTGFSALSNIAEALFDIIAKVSRLDLISLP
jgi:hypothetical protein